MNELETICARVKSTPQPLWYDLRYKPIMNWYLSKVNNDSNFHNEVKAQFFELLGTRVYYCVYDRAIYVFTFAKVGQVIDWYRVEKILPSFTTEEGILVSSSDDDPNQDRTIPLLCTMCGVSTAGELYHQMLP